MTWSRPIKCTDSFGRQRSVTVFATPGQPTIGLIAPPGETALLNPAQLEELQQALTDACTVAAREPVAP